MNPDRRIRMYLRILIQGVQDEMKIEDGSFIIQRYILSVCNNPTKPLHNPEMIVKIKLCPAVV